jgi:hypothetical protein
MYLAKSQRRDVGNLEKNCGNYLREEDNKEGRRQP